MSASNMVRTAADASARKAVAAKAPRKVLGGGNRAGGAGTSASFVSPAKGVDKYAGGNSVCVRPTPSWQKTIGSFCQVINKENTAPQVVDMSEEDLPKSQENNETLSQESGSSSAGRPTSRSPSPHEESPVKKSPISDDEDD